MKTFNIFNKRKQEALPVVDQTQLQQAEALGLFDAGWYQQQYGQKFASSADAFQDYLHKSRFAPVHPSPAFDGESYHRMYMDVFYDQQSPLFHYLKNGKQEGRQHVPLTPRWVPNSRMPLDIPLSEAASQLKMAICLHVFYEDFIDRFAEALNDMPINVDVLLTLAAGVDETRARKTFSRHACVSRVETRRVPNRGRNFGPLLVEYADQLEDYDLFCHLHSKKSLYSGREQTQWADYLTEFLLRDKSVVKRALNAFAADDTLGLYYPTTFWMMPSWVNHQTMNKGFMREWQESLEIEHVNDFLSYPAGGMFWARPMALKGIADRVWKYEDFPEEPLPNDGSQLHALERVLGAQAENLGYRQFFYHPSSGDFTADQSYITASYHGSIEQHLPAIQSHQIISFDVFDTLVRREFTVADYAKLKLGKWLVEQGVVTSAHDFVALRNKAEFTLRKRASFQGDIRIDAIYDELADVLKVTKDVAQGWMKREFELDLAMIQPKDEMVELFNHLGSSGHVLWVISDTYYTRDQVGLMLRKAGVAAAYRLMVSSEEGKRKDSGTMWAMVKEDLANEHGRSHLHIGDNVVADAQRPGDMGLVCFHILHPMDKWRALGMPDVLNGKDALDEAQILKWGALVSQIGRNPFIGE
ncbi:rhamnan synthesis F family protein [Cobetia sp. L2A1]|uniref:rhamnan synthesis F family protein n=1 Tax=Cobetia sp. L2A1 TaxID=2686360 RepID=UPI00131BCD02|nr:rhamnan synthesis F family protein [Cobetia sp. L2A1]